ncbi:MAG: 16S rRNA (cytidine(1402)-2'-O)-methyltransferase [candidate division Zixibacteria bacterium]
MSPKGILYLVPTPIGNLEDITIRAMRILGEVDIIACEDTRRTGQLLSKLKIKKKKFISYHDFNESGRADQLLNSLNEGQSVAVVTDAGSPGISDPGYRIVRTAIENDIEIVPLPGPTSAIPALTASGLPTDRFFFEGYLSHKSSGRRKKLAELKELSHTLIFFESPHRLVKSLNDMHEILGDRRACVAREMTKIYEQFERGTISEILDKFSILTVKGEIVIVVEGKIEQKGSKKRNDFGK